MAGPTRIFDALSYLPTREVILDLAVSLPPQMNRYLRDVFGPRIAPLMGLSAEELFNLKTSLSPDALREALAPRVEPFAMEAEPFVQLLADMGVERAVLFNLDERSASGLSGLPNDYYADLVGQYPETFIGIAGIDPRGEQPVREIHRCRKLGLRGIGMRPFMFRLPPHDPLMTPIYEACVELDMPVWLHMGINYSSLSMEVERPIYLDVVAEQFPELTLIAGHGAWPWVVEMMAVAWRNPNVYLDIASIEPRYLTQPGSGWETLMHFGNSVLQDRVLFASTWLFMGKSIRQLAEDVWGLPLKDEVKDKWLFRNAAKLFGVATDE